MQVAGSGVGLSQMRGMSVVTQILRSDGIPGIFRGFGTSAVGSMPGKVLAFTSLEMSKDIMLKYTEGSDIPEASRIGLANGVAGMVSNLVSCVYFVPLDVAKQSIIFHQEATKVNLQLHSVVEVDLQLKLYTAAMGVGLHNGASGQLECLYHKK